MASYGLMVFLCLSSWCLLGAIYPVAVVTDAMWVFQKCAPRKQNAWSVLIADQTHVEKHYYCFASCKNLNSTVNHLGKPLLSAIITSAELESQAKHNVMQACKPQSLSWPCFFRVGVHDLLNENSCYVQALSRRLSHDCLDPSATNDTARSVERKVVLNFGGCFRIITHVML